MIANLSSQAPISTISQMFFASSVALLAALSVTACMQSSQENTPEFQAACHGKKLTLAEADQALSDGYQINPMLLCIDKASYQSVQEQKARWLAANTPEARAKEAAARAEQAARDQAAREAEAAKPAPPEPPPYVLRKVEINTAREDELAAIPSLGASTAAAIVAARRERPFSGWEDVVRRIVALSQAKTVFVASVSGLVVNGKSLDGAPPDPQMAAIAQAPYQRAALKP
jgi:DNA uptake protein ComE-like DNA-binding protein